MKIGELRTKTDEDLRAFLEDLYEKLRVMRFDFAQGKVKNTAALREARKDIARVKTITRERSAKNTKQ